MQIQLSIKLLFTTYLLFMPPSCLMLDMKNYWVFKLEIPRLRITWNIVQSSFLLNFSFHRKNFTVIDVTIQLQSQWESSFKQRQKYRNLYRLFNFNHSAITVSICKVKNMLDINTTLSTKLTSAGINISSKNSFGFLK